MSLHDELAPLPVVDAELHEPLLSIGETAGLLGISLAGVVDLACQERSPLPVAEDARGRLGFYRSEVECWQAEQA